MASTVLVDTDRNAVARLVEAVDEHRLDLRIILLAKFEDYYGARLVVASPAFDEHRELFNYKDFGSILREYGLDDDVPSPLLIKMNDPVTLALRTRFGYLDDQRGLRLGPQLLGDRFVEDGMLYRVH